MPRGPIAGDDAEKLDHDAERARAPPLPPPSPRSRTRANNSVRAETRRLRASERLDRERAVGLA